MTAGEFPLHGLIAIYRGWPNWSMPGTAHGADSSAYTDGDPTHPAHGWNQAIVHC